MIINLYSPSDESELTLIASILGSENIPFFTHNDHFESLRIAPPIDLFNKKTIMIDKAFEEMAGKLPGDSFKTAKESEAKAPSYRLFDRLRMVFETLIFGWFIPGRRRDAQAPGGGDKLSHCQQGISLVAEDGGIHDR